MKKTLAILLALIMAASVALTACEESSENNEDLQDDFNKDFGTQASETVTDEEGNVISTDENGSDVEYTPGSTSNMETVNDTVYVLHSAAIREKAKVTSNKVGDAPFGTKLTRTEKNNKWSKVKYTVGEETIEGYIANDVITTNEKTVTFEEKKNEDGSAVMTKVKAKDVLGASNAIIRKYPLAAPADGFDVLDKDEFNSVSIVAQIPAGTEVELVKVSADGKWAYVKGKGNKPVNGEFPENPVDVEGYTAYSNLEIAGANTSNGNDDIVG